MTYLEYGHNSWSGVFLDRFHLQALRHLYVLACEPRLFITRDVDTKAICYIPISVTVKVTLSKRSEIKYHLVTVVNRLKLLTIKSSIITRTILPSLHVKCAIQKVKNFLGYNTNIVTVILLGKQRLSRDWVQVVVSVFHTWK